MYETTLWMSRLAGGHTLFLHHSPRSALPSAACDGNGNSLFVVDDKDMESVFFRQDHLFESSWAIIRPHPNRPF
jgi:hypothetical protein